LNNVALLILVFFLVSCTTTKRSNEIWYELSNKIKEKDANLPSDYLYYRLDIALLKERLLAISGDSLEIKLAFPNPRGKMIEYLVKKSDVISEDLLNKYPDLAAYKGTAILDSRSKIRFELPKGGLQLMGTTLEGTWFISPFPFNSGYMVYDKSKLRRENTFWEGRTTD